MHLTSRTNKFPCGTIISG